MKGIILHGGHGTRLRPLTHTGPKQLLPIANKPISQYVLEDLINSEVKDIAMILGEVYPEKVKEYYGDGSRFQATIRYIHQGAPKGIAHAVSLCKDYVNGDSFIVYLGDNLLKGGIKTFTTRFKDSDHDAMILLCEVKNPQRFGVAKLDTNGKLIGLVEKPKEPPSKYALTGIYFLKPVIFQMIETLTPSWRGELEITDAIQLLLDKGFSVGYDFVEGWWKDTGIPKDILEANRLILDEHEPTIEGSIGEGASLQGRVSIGKRSTIDPGALIRGPTIIGQDSTIEDGVYIGPYTSIGDNVTIKKGELENSIIMNNCLINVEERIIDSLIGPYTTICSDNDMKPQGRRLILGERSHLQL
jgi:glucose-1-phosphate thymidylyltransferase